MIERGGKGEECGEHSKVVSTGEFWKCLPAWGYLNPLNPLYIAIFHTGSGPTLGWLGLTYVSQLCPFPLLAQDCPYLLTSLLQFCLSKQLWSQPPTLRGHPISKALSPFEISTAVAVCAQLSLSTLHFSTPGSVHKDSVHALRTDSPTVAHAVLWNCLHGKNGNIFFWTN